MENFNEEIFQRTEILLGKEKLQKLYSKTVAVFGLGGVGSYVVEGLVRTGVQNFILVDKDKIDITNINRQIIATTKTIGEYKVDVEEKRIKEINPRAKVKTYKEFIAKESDNENIEIIKIFEELKKVDYIIDAIDTVSAKLRIIEFADKNNIKVISALGTGNKIDPTKLRLEDIYNTQVCPLAKVMRKELKERGISHLKVVYSKEIPHRFDEEYKQTPASISFVPSVAGLILAGEVIKDLIN